MSIRFIRINIVLATALAWSLPASAQDKGTLNPKPLPPLADPANPRLPAKEVFGRALTPVEAQARSIGFYSRGCLAGAKALPVDGASWQVVRLSRNRMWGNPAMIAFLERFSHKAKAEGVWNGILVGDISQPRGGPMLTGHASHQVGLDADVWLTPMPDRTLSKEERETMSAVDMVTEDGLSVDRTRWTPAQAEIIKAAAEEPEVERIFVNAAIKKALCETAKGQSWTPAASHRSRSRPAMAATSRSPGGSPTRRCIRASGCPSRRCRWRRSRPNAGKSFWRNKAQAPSESTSDGWVWGPNRSASARTIVETTKVK
jgi:penicillin-insensitive murein endopeptidase